MLQNQFIQFASTVDGTTSHLPVPVVNGIQEKFLFNVGTTYQNPSTYTPIIDIVNSDASSILLEGAATIETPTVTSPYRMALMSNFANVAIGNCFRLRNRVVQYSGTDRIVSTDTNLNYTFTSSMVLIKTLELTVGKYTLDFINTSVTGMNYAVMLVLDANGSTIKQSSIYSGELSTSFNLNINTAGTYRVYLVNERAFTFTADTLQVQEHRYVSSQVVLGYSNLLKRVDALDDYSIAEYWCDEEEFGFPFNLSSINYPFRERLILPLRISDPQYKQEDEVYEKLSGEKVVLYASIGKEYELETEYLSEDWHDKIIIALSCDHITIDSVSVAKSGEYSVDWENYQTLDGGAKAAKGEAKVTLNYNSRNSN